MQIKKGEVSKIPCPNCSPVTSLVIRENSKNGNLFLGCPNWPSCRHTQSIPEAWKMRAAGIQELF